MIFLLLSALFAEDHILVKVEDTTSLEGMVVIERVFENWFSIKVPEDKDPETFCLLVKGCKGVLEATPDYIYHALWSPNDSFYRYQWNLRKFINLERTWDLIGGGSEDIIIAILDTGCSFEEYPVPEYERSKVVGDTYHIYSDYNKSSFVKGYDFVNDDEHPNDDNGHGTMVSGVIVEATDNRIGLAGIAYGTRVMPVKVLDYDGTGYTSDIAEGIEYAVENGARVINLSLGDPQSSPLIKDAVSYAYKSGVILVAASGNDGTYGVYYPAAYDEVIAVGAYDSLGRVASYSNYGTQIELVAPGGDVTYSDSMWIFQQCFSPYIEGWSLAVLDTVGYYGMIGTSLAAPHISALCALILSVAPGFTPLQVRRIIQKTAQDIMDSGWDMYSGFGIPDFYEAVKLAIQQKYYGELTDIITVSSTLSGNFSAISKNGLFTITKDSSYTVPLHLSIVNIAGQKIGECIIDDTPYTLFIENPGVYFLYGNGRGGVKLIVTK